MLDHLQSTASFVSNKLNCLVLDEVDRLLDMGFESKVKSIYAKLVDNADNKFQKILISATINSEVEQLATFCIGPGESFTPVNIIDKKFQVPKTLQHKYVIAPLRYKFLLLIALLIKCRKAVVFVSNCTAVDYFHNLLSVVTWPNEVLKDKQQQKEILKIKVYKIHGKISPDDRIGFMGDFTRAETGILVATDVASRGLNLHVDLVVQFDPPQQLGEYVHRSGRTARLGSTGIAVLMLLESEQGKPFIIT